MIQIEEKYRLLVKKILEEETSLDFYVFGSRAKEKSGRFSDLDLAYKGHLEKKSLLNIKTKLAESNLPFTVDIVNLDECDESFLDLIQDDLKSF